MSEANCALRVALGLAERELVAFVGGGGKTAALQRLARELGAHERSVAVTTTTRMYYEQLAALGPVVVSNDFQVLLTKLRRLLADSPVASAGLELEPGGKLRGLPENWVDELKNSRLAEYLLVEADGSRGRSLKAHAEHEPVIPLNATLVVPVVGLDVLGKPLSPEFIHRPELAARLAGTDLYAPVSCEVVARIMAHPSGLGKAIPSSARVVPLINKVDRPGDLSLARRLAAVILGSSKTISRVVLANCGGQRFTCEVVRK